MCIIMTREDLEVKNGKQKYQELIKSSLDLKDPRKLNNKYLEEVYRNSHTSLAVK